MMRFLIQMRASFPPHILASLLLLAVSPLPFTVAANNPTPIVASVGTNFLGYDGLWSPVSLRVGTPEQWLFFLPNTLSQETWVVGPAGCDGTSLCTGKRGGLFFANESSTFRPQGFFDIDSDSRIFNDQAGYYGFDTIALSDMISVTDQIVAVANSTEFWIGNMGLGVQQTRFSGNQNISPLLSSLVEDIGAIPSHSYGYTAGASYRLKMVPASLTLGGVDANRFVPNNMSFTLASNYAPVVAVNSITVSASPPGDDTVPSNWDANPQTLLDTPQADYLFTIDSSTSFLWLPARVCDQFASALNLTYDDNLQLYTFSNESTSPANLDAWNLTFTFGISNLPRAPEQIELTLPYGAFNLQLSYPFPNLQANFSSPPTNYFPLRRAANSSQYIIGRAFLQETYLAVDYERNNFSLSQAVFTLDAVNNVDLQSITRPEGSIFPGPPVSPGLSTGAKAGIGIGAAVGVILAVVLIWWFCFRRKKAQDTSDVEKKDNKSKRPSFLSRIQRPPVSETSVSELLADRHHPAEAPADSSATRFELSGNNAIEMPAEPVPPSFYTSNSGSTPISRNDPRRPTELENRNSMTKGTEATATERSASPVPPYSPAELNKHRNSSSVSPYSGENSGGFGTMSSGEQGISPVALHAGQHSRQPRTSNERSPVSTDMSIPISPELLSASQQHAPNDPEASPRLNPSNGSLLVPQFNGRPLSRSPSTGSRFVEEGLTTMSEEQPPSSTTPQHRFSWEQ